MSPQPTLSASALLARRLEGPAPEWAITLALAAATLLAVAFVAYLLALASPWVP
jgi:hypothetical protein